MKEHQYYDNSRFTEAVFPNTTLRHIGHLVRNVRPIEGYRAVVDLDTDRTFAIVSAGYKLIQHQEVVNQIDTLVGSMPEWGAPNRELWLSNYGARLKVRYTFPEIDFEIKPGDVVHPTIETLASFDTTLAQKMLVGGFRLVCSNGMVVGKTLASYKRKHTVGLNLDQARSIMQDGMARYSEAAELWKAYTNRLATPKEVFAYETSLPFHTIEKAAIEMELRKQGRVLQWDDDDKTKRQVEINAWDLYNILTAEATHRVQDVTRSHQILEGVPGVFS